MNKLAVLLRLAGLGAILALLFAAPAEAQRPTIEVQTDLSGSSARLVLTHSRQVVYAVREADDRVEVVYAEPILVAPPDARPGSPILERYELRAGNTLTFYIGRNYRNYESFELRNPFRLVLDLRGTLTAEQELAQAAPRYDPSRTVIVIDAGHGGVENGATGPTGLREKDVTLDLARRLRQELEKNPSVSVVLTRDEDRLIGLDERTAIANHNRAELFLSIHLNASRTNARGAETYFLSADATDDEARTLAALENRASGVDEESIVTSEGERRDLDLVLWDLAQNQYLAESSALAESVQRHLNTLTGTRNRGIRQAPFRVLMGATMPAILVEVGFISNAEEEAEFRGTGYRNRVVDAIAAAVREFLAGLERTAGRP